MKFSAKNPCLRVGTVTELGHILCRKMASVMHFGGFLPPCKVCGTPLAPETTLFAITHRGLQDAKNRKWLTRRIRVAR